MRISNINMQNNGINNMIKSQNSVNKSQLQIALQTKIIQPSDDPIATSQINVIEAYISKNENYNQSIESATNQLNMVDTTLDGFANTLIRIEELQKQSMNGTMQADDKKAISVEVQQLLEHLLSLSRTKDIDNNYIFSGFQSNSQPVELVNNEYVYHGDSGKNEINISLGTSVFLNYTGEEVFFNSNGDNVFNLINEVITTLDEENTQEIFNTKMLSLAEKMNSCFDNVIDVKAKVDANLTTLDAQKQINDDFILLNTKMLSELKDLDPVEAATNLVSQMKTLESMQISFMRINQLSLLNFL